MERNNIQKNAGENLRHCLTKKHRVYRTVSEVLFQIVIILFFVTIHALCFIGDTSLSPHSSGAYFLKIKTKSCIDEEAILKVLDEVENCWALKNDPYLNNVYDIVYISPVCLKELFRINPEIIQVSTYAITNNSVLAQQIESLYDIEIVGQKRICLGSNMLNRYCFLITEQINLVRDTTLIIDGFDSVNVDRAMELISKKLKKDNVEFNCQKTESYDFWKFLKANNLLYVMKLLPLAFFLMKEFYILIHRKNYIKDNHLSSYLLGLSFFERIVLLLSENLVQYVLLVFLPLILIISDNCFLSKAGMLCFLMLVLELVFLIVQCMCLGTRKKNVNAIMEL